MRKILLLFVLAASIGFTALPANAATPKAEKNSVMGSSGLNQVRTRYVRVRGRRYRVTYRIVRRGGRYRYQILSYRRA
jgi:hypothetical protein